MAVKVIKFKVRHEGKTYTTENGNNVIEGLSKAEEKRLIEAGFCEKVVEIKADKKKSNSEEKDKKQNQNKDNNQKDNNQKDDDQKDDNQKDDNQDDDSAKVDLNLNPDDVIVDKTGK